MDTKLLFDVGITAFYDGDLEAGRLASEVLLARPDLDPQMETVARRNQIFYAPTLDELAPSLNLVPFAVPVEPGWSCFNPSIAAATDGYRAIARSSNYRLHKGWYEIFDPHQVVRTTNYLVDLSPPLTVRGSERLFEPEGGVRSDFPVKGYEDCRLFFWDGAWHVSATVRDRNEAGVCQQALARIAGTRLRDIALLNDWRDGRDEKNWMPFVAGGELRFVYGCHPVRVVAFRPNTGAVETVVEHPAPPLARSFRGGSQVVAVPGGWLCLIHESVVFEDGGRVYPHRFVFFDEAFRLAKVSPQFFFVERGVEYCAGLALAGDRLIASFGREDREASFAALPLAEALATLAPPLDPATADFAPVTDYAAWRWPAPGPAKPAVAPTSPEDLGFTPFPAPAGDDPERPWLVSTTLSGNSRDLIVDALRSAVDWVDACLLIDTGITDDTLAVARDVAGAKLVVRRFSWRSDFAAARNFALQAAAELGAAWAMTLDTDERLDRNGLDVRGILAATRADLLHVRQVDGSYVKERFFRLPAPGRWVGPTHEAYVGAGVTEEMPNIRFWEVRKSEADYRRKFERDVAILTHHTAEHPTDPRWFYYLGDALQNLGRHEEAIAAYRSCWALDGWDEESAWAMYRAAECHLALGRHKAAIAACADGMLRHPGLADLPWLAAFAAYGGGRADQAVWWATQAAALGCLEGVGDQVTRIGFSNPRARFEGPYDILRFALRDLGRIAEADEAEAKFEAAMALRQRELGPD